MFIPSRLFRVALAAAMFAASSVAPSFAEEATAAAATGRITFAPGIDPKEKVPQISFSDMEVKDVLTQLEWLTGRIIIRPQALPSVLLTLNAKSQDLTRAEALVAFESLLSINGIGLAPLGDRFIKVVATGQIRSEAPELIVGSLLNDPPSGKIVSKLFRLQYLDPTSFQTQIAPFLSPFGFVVPFQTSNAVIVTDTVANLQRLEYVVTEVDHRLNIETKFYELHYASATDLAQSIKQMLDSARAGFTGSRTGAPGAQPVNVPVPTPAGGGGASGVALQAVFSSNTSINADTRTNQLIVITDPANLPFFDNLIAKLDIAADPPTTIEVIPMNYAKATDLVSVLSQVVSGRSQATTSSSSTRRPGSTTQQRPQFTALGTVTQPQQNQPRQQAVQNAQNVVQAVTGGAEGSQFSQYMTIVADERTNAVIVSGTNTDVALIRKIIDQLDIVLAQVRIEVIIAEVTLTKTLVRGIDAFNGIHWEEATGAFKAGVNATATDKVSGPLGAFVSGTLAGGRLSDITLDGVLNAARTNDNVNLLSVPTIVTTHNQPATILVGESRPIISNSTATTAGVTSSVSYQDIPLQLDVTPVIGPNNVVQLEIKQQVNAVTSTVTIDGAEQPIVSRREATSFISVKDQQLVVLGGLQKAENTKSKSHMFILGEIPLLGELFTRTNNSTIRTDLLIFLKPTVLRNTDEADANARASVRELPVTKEDAVTLKKLSGEDAGQKPDSEPPPAGPRRHRP